MRKPTMRLPHQRWQITELALFGSILRDDFQADSDIDLLVTFAPEAQWSLFDHVDMQDELQALVGRPVDLLTRKSIERSQNYLRRQAILDSAEVIYLCRLVMKPTFWTF